MDLRKKNVDYFEDLIQLGEKIQPLSNGMFNLNLGNKTCLMVSKCIADNYHIDVRQHYTRLLEEKVKSEVEEYLLRLPKRPEFVKYLGSGLFKMSNGFVVGRGFVEEVDKSMKNHIVNVKSNFSEVLRKELKGMPDIVKDCLIESFQKI